MRCFKPLSSWWFVTAVSGSKRRVPTRRSTHTRVRPARRAACQVAATDARRRPSLRAWGLSWASPGVQQPPGSMSTERRQPAHTPTCDNRTISRRHQVSPRGPTTLGREPLHSLSLYFRSYIWGCLPALTASIDRTMQRGHVFK